MENNKPVKRHLFNLFDVIIIGIIAVILAVVLIYMLRSRGTSVSTEQTKTVRYMVELTDMNTGTAEAIKQGDELIDTIKKYDVGEVISCEIVPTVKSAKNLETGEFVNAVVPDRETAMILLEAECTDTENQYLAGGGFKVCGGEQVSLKGPGYYGSGYILYVVRGDES
ncbi:MAG: DUF4330 family protein [Oscillospiraceae bacterium]